MAFLIFSQKEQEKVVDNIIKEQIIKQKQTLNSVIKGNLYQQSSY